VRFFRRFAGNHAASRRVESSSSWKFIRLAPCDYEIQSRRRRRRYSQFEEEKKRGKAVKESMKVRNSGRKCIDRRKWVCLLHPACSLVAESKCRSSARVVFLCLANSHRSLSARVNHIDLRMSFARSRFLPRSIPPVTVLHTSITVRMMIK
jgi:hypothetical protein